MNAARREVPARCWAVKNLSEAGGERLAAWMAEAERVISDPPDDVSMVLETLEALHAAVRDALSGESRLRGNREGAVSMAQAGAAGGAGTPPC